VHYVTKDPIQNLKVRAYAQAPNCDGTQFCARQHKWPAKSILLHHS